MQHVLETSGLWFSYRRQGSEPTAILKGVNLHVDEGELVAIKGPSGSGKSTLLYILSGLLGPYEGRVSLLGKDLAAFSEPELAALRNRHIGFVFQQFYLLPKLNLLENILIPGQYRGADFTESGEALKERARAIASKVDLGDRLTHYPNQLSGGQQQRVAIARALLNDPSIILADEPTGSLDTANSEQILRILRQSVDEGRSALIITHDSEVASRCDRVISFRDGVIEEDAKPGKRPPARREEKVTAPQRRLKAWETVEHFVQACVSLVPSATRNLLHNKGRSVLTMMGIVIGIAAILSMLTIGKFTEKKILESYAELGVNTLAVYGYPNWDLKATDKVPSMFQAFDWEKDISHLDKTFPQIERATPMMVSWDNRANFGGKSIESEVRVMGVTADGLEIMNRKLLLGTGFTPVHVQQRMAVCIIGHEIFQRLFTTTNPIGQIIHVTQRETSYGCKVLGVLKAQTTNKEWNKPNLQIITPFTYFQTTSDPWSSRIRELAFQIQAGSDIERVGKGIKAFFERRYGKSGRFIVGSDSVLLAQMKKFLNLFTLLLGLIALVSVAVGGIGITNMMLVSISERLKEIGVRKAFGATNFSIWLQYLLESVIICSVGGLVGIVVGFAVYELAIYGASQVIKTLKFEWVFDWTAIAVSFISIVGVGILSGIIPAMKAEKLEVIEALRSE
jgi:macrolide transport system ATP-binding/permease protein